MLFEHACEQALGAYFRQEDTVGVRFREWSACQNLVRNELKQVGWTKRLEPAKVARRDRERFDCATWLHKAREMPKEEFRREVERELTGKEEPHEIIYFKVYKSRRDPGDRASVGDSSVDAR